MSCVVRGNGVGKKHRARLSVQLGLALVMIAPPTLQVIRGRSWYFDTNSTRCGLRSTHASKDRCSSLGFRPVQDVPRP